jgi:hypothetical protein
MMRRKKAPSMKNEENLDREFEQEQARLDAKKNKLDHIAEERVKAIFGDRPEQLELQERTRRDMEAQLQLKEEMRKREMMEELKYSTELQEQALISQVVEHDHEKARRDYLRSVMEENKRLATEKEAAIQRQRQREIENERNAKGKLLEWGGHFR